jgi:hypothetical protein
MSSVHAFAIEVHGRSAGIVVAQRGGFMFFAAERAFQPLDRRVFKHVTHAETAARRALAEHDRRYRS